MAAVTYSNTDINRFWLQIISDGILIVYNALSPLETEDAKQARALADRFDDLALRANQEGAAEQTAQINSEALQAAQDARRYFLYIAKNVVTKDYYLDLQLAVINNFINETERYIELLNAFTQGKQPAFDPIREEIFWLPIFTQQSNYISDNVGFFQKENRERALNLADIFNEYWSFSNVLLGFSRIGRTDFPIALQHHRAVVDALTDYYEFMTSFVALQRREAIIGSMSLLYMDRARRMACFFLTQMSLYLDLRSPDCDPYAQRISSV
jgi:hypothetical protein